MGPASTAEPSLAAPRVGGAAPAFELPCVDAEGGPERRVRLEDYAGRWLVLIFYPRDFSFVCPTELTAFSARIADFQKRDAVLLAVSVDSLELHREWLTTPPRRGGLGPLQFPLGSDPDGRAARAFGVWDPDKKVSIRGLFLIDPDGVLQYAVIHNLSVGRSADEVLRVLDALRTGGLCPASWTSADGIIDPEKALQPGSVLGHYRIRAPLGSGTFGTVFSARDLHLERLVALKVLKRNISESREALLNEARAAARLNHPHVCTIYAVEEADGLPLIVMEHLDGQSLSQRIDEGLERTTALRLAAQIAQGLLAAHQQQVVHGDFKPANVMVTDAGAKILDFGLSRSHHARTPCEGKARRSAPAREPALVFEGVELSLDRTVDIPPEAGLADDSIRGTPAYMAPEQAEGHPATPASDVFSFGLTLYEMLTGRSAHERTSVLDMLLRLRTANLAQELAPQVEPGYQDLLAAMLSRNPAQRPCMEEVAQRLNDGGV